MSKIYYMMGKSSTGKDTLYKRIFGNEELQLKTVVLYTTRPIREGRLSSAGIIIRFMESGPILQ